jgi:hypothetical protein
VRIQWRTVRHHGVDRLGSRRIERARRQRERISRVAHIVDQDRNLNITRSKMWAQSQGGAGHTDLVLYVSDQYFHIARRVRSIASLAIPVNESDVNAQLVCQSCSPANNSSQRPQ